MKDKTIVKVVAIVCLTVIWTVNALTFKVDGTLLTAIATIIGGIAGYTIKNKQIK